MVGSISLYWTEILNISEASVKKCLSITEVSVKCQWSKTQVLVKYQKGVIGVVAKLTDKYCGGQVDQCINQNLVFCSKDDLL